MDPLAVRSGPICVDVQHVTLAVCPLKIDIRSPVCASNAPHVPSAHAVTNMLMCKQKNPPQLVRWEWVSLSRLRRLFSPLQFCCHNS